MDDREVKVRCLEVASRLIGAHPQGAAVGALEIAKGLSEWVLGQPPMPGKSTLGLPKK